MFCVIISESAFPDNFINIVVYFFFFYRNSLPSGLSHHLNSSKGGTGTDAFMGPPEGQKKKLIERSSSLTARKQSMGTFTQRSLLLRTVELLRHPEDSGFSAWRQSV
jgi:hypothetical protein